MEEFLTDKTIVTTANKGVRILDVVFQAHDGRDWIQSKVRNAWVLDIPNIRVHGHVGGHLLELKHRVGDSDLVPVFGIPRDIRSCSFNRIGIPRYLNFY